MQKRLYQIELLRFIFCIIIVYYHILHANIMGYTGIQSEKYKALATQSDYAAAIVECFFILAGYFLYRSYLRRPKETIVQFLYKKVTRLWPVLTFSSIVGIIFFKYRIYPQIFNILFLQTIGISLEYRGINWYISPYFFASIFYFSILKCFRDKKKVNLIICILVYFSYVLNIENTGGGFCRETVYGIFNLGMFRAIAGIGLGYLLSAGTKYAQDVMADKKLQLSKGYGLGILLGTSVLEVGSFILLMIHFLRREYAYNNQFIVVILFSVLLLSLISGRGVLSRIFNHKCWGIWGKYTYSIYVMQQISFFILQRTLWKRQTYVENHMYRCLAVSVLFSIAVGIITYYVVERPCVRLSQKAEKYWSRKI